MCAIIKVQINDQNKRQLGYIKPCLVLQFELCRATQVYFLYTVLDIIFSSLKTEWMNQLYLCASKTTSRYLKGNDGWIVSDNPLKVLMCCRDHIEIEIS
jgi:hypothetical protein